MATIISTGKRQLTNEDKYRMMKSPEIKKMSEAADSEIEITAWMQYEDVDSSGEIKRIVSVLTPENECYASNSASFQRDFESILECFGDEFNAIKVIKNRGKSGRTYLTCAYVR